MLKKTALFLRDGFRYDGVSAGIWVIHKEVANLGVTLFDRYSYDAYAGIWVLHTGPKSGGSW